MQLEALGCDPKEALIAPALFTTLKGSSWEEFESVDLSNAIKRITRRIGVSENGLTLAKWRQLITGIVHKKLVKTPDRLKSVLDIDFAPGDYDTELDFFHEQAAHSAKTADDVINLVSSVTVESGFVYSGAVAEHLQCEVTFEKDPRQWEIEDLGVAVAASKVFRHIQLKKILSVWLAPSHIPPPSKTS